MISGLKEKLKTWRVSASGATALFVLAVCLTVILHEIVRIWTQYEDAISDIRKDTSNLARSMIQHAEDTFRIADAILINSVERIEGEGRDTATLERLRRLFQEEVARLPQLRGLSILDENGISIVNSLVVTQPIDFSDRDYFQYHVSHEDRMAHIGKPVRSKATNDWVIPVSRRINHADGSFAGIALATVDVWYFQRFYERFNIGEGGAILLATTSGTLLVRRPFVEANIGRDMTRSGLFQALQDSHAGSVEIKSSTDGVVRINGFGRGETYPIVLAVAEETNEMLAPWWRDANWQMLKSLALIATIIGLGFLIWRRTQEVSAQGALLQATLENMNQGLIVVDGGGRVAVCNRQAMELLDLPPELMAGAPRSEEVIAYQENSGEFQATSDDVRPKLLPKIHEASAYGYERMRPDGRVLDIRTVPLAKGGVVRTYTDVTEQKRTEANLRRSESQYRLLADNTSDLVARLGADLRYNYASPASIDILGYRPEELIGLRAGDLVCPSDKAEWLEALVAAQRDNTAVTQATYRVLRKDGAIVWIEENRRQLPETSGFILSMRDISRRKEAERLLKQANHRLKIAARRDGLTGTANRRHFDETFDQEFRRARRDGTPLALVMIDTDQFKRFNDIYGHPAGDGCLRSVAFALAETLRRPGDFIARYGGEEFAVLLPNTALQGALTIANTLRKSVEELRIPHEANPGGVVTVSLGIAVAMPGDGTTRPESLLAVADEALYAAKRQGRNCACFGETPRDRPLRAAG